MEVKRGDVITVVIPGDYGKPRPAVVVQSDFFEQHPSVTIIPITSNLHKTPLFRVTIQPDPANGLRKPSQITIDKIMTIARARIGSRVGVLDRGTMLEVSRRLAVFLGLAG